MTGRTYIVSHMNGTKDCWLVYEDEERAKAAYQRLLAKAEDQDELDLISLSAVIESSDYETHPAFEPKNAATSFSDALDAYIKETVNKTVNEQLAVSEKYVTKEDLELNNVEFVTEDDVITYVENEGFMTQEDVDHFIRNEGLMTKDAVEECIDENRFVDRDDVDVMLEDMLEDFMHKEAIEQSIEESVEKGVKESIQREVDMWSEGIDKRTASQVKGLVPDVIKRLINDGQIALTTKTASDPINL